ncbi:hypothetical protein N9N28_14640 [Rubripirellula amarantea]|uniref:Uncharacterized protein n=1 Tax=Rubripirellula amarantea TaxID=2527999 RepID=A0A5C5WXL0_9BACT|nr:hypothetical protein [Rubripirellula amarantea]MDA8745863.1 hypothetical protein [Rubripirellula amarantea]TWT54861.1 hypothetical protein Pla22_25150 [Rubripirellula amarantea]
MSKTNYYTEDDLSTWERIKKAFANDWEQTKADFGSDTARDMNQDVDDTLKQMAGSDDAFENREQAFRFGYTAQQRYHSSYPKWNDELDTKLRNDYDGDYEADRAYIRHAYGYRPVV